MLPASKNSKPSSAETAADLDALYRRLRDNRWRIAKTSAAERVVKLKKLREAIFAMQKDLHKAIHDDFRKNPAETDLTETHLVIAEINDAIKHLAKWMKPKKVKTPMTLFGTSSEIRCEPKGVVLILSPWNYPFQLAVSPVVAAVSAGNVVLLKPSNKTPNTARFLKKLMAEVFPEDEIAVVEGDHTVADALLEYPFDHIFFTGSPNVGKKIMTAAAKHLAPVTLELGGKSPVVVDETADIKKTASRVMWAKFINAGQTCVAPDYLLIHESKAKEFVEEAKKAVASRYGDTPAAQAKSEDYCRLVSEQHGQGLQKVLDESIKQGAKVEIGGLQGLNGDARFLPPTLLTNVTPETAIMREEIFGPILPILTYRNLDEAIALIRSREKPLALYVFSNDRAHTEEILKNTTAGGSCVNSLAVHLANPNLPFGGVGMSGMGNYHGYFGFKTFSHERAVLRQGAIDTLKFFYPPYTPKLRKMIDFLTKHLS
ncbi:MAG TPA: aldehyde dehydrogenase family protein [bacterium]|nr:aldehyde dehydrogenase family protein [bacterium]